MNFKSFYSRIILLLTTVFAVLFILMEIPKTILLKYYSEDFIMETQEGRIQYVFTMLDQRFRGDWAAPLSPDQATRLTTFLDSMGFVYNLDVYDKRQRWLAGTSRPLYRQDGIVRHEQLNHKKSLWSFSGVFFNPNKNSPFHAIRIELKPRDHPIFWLLLKMMLVASAVTMIVAMVVGRQLANYVNRRLERLRQGVLRISQGDFDVKLEDEGSDEIAFLARSFNLMSQRLRKLIQRLEESNAARQRLFAHASHEIKSPLTSIKGFIDIVEYMQILPEDKRDNLLTTVKKDIQRVIKVTEDMLQIARIQQPGYQLQPRRFDMEAFMLEEHRHFQRKCSQLGARAILRHYPSARMQVYTDPERLSQILDNLWGNALKYGKLTRPIVTEVHGEHGLIRIRISNYLQHKLPVPAEQLMEPFFRVPATAKKVAGSGLGLVVVRELTEALGGSIQIGYTRKKLWVEISLPCIESAPAATPTETAADAPGQ